MLMNLKRIKNDITESKKSSDYQIKLSSERSEKRKPTNTWGYWKLIESNNRKWKKKKLKKSISEYLRKLLETKLHSRNLVEGINIRAVVRYSGPFLKWTREELKQMDQRTRKLMTMHKALHPRDEVDRLYVLRREGGRGLAGIEDSVDTSK